MRTLTLFMATLVSVLGLSFAAQADPTIDLLFAGSNSIGTSAGATVTVDVVMSFPVGETSNGYQFTIGWDTTELSFIGGSLVNIALPGQGTSGFQELFATGFSLPGSISSAGPAPAPGGTFTIGHLSFVVLGGLVDDGNADITAYFDQANTFSTDFISSGAGNYAATVFNGAGVNTIIPEPTTASLLGLGLIGLTVAGRRRS